MSKLNYLHKSLSKTIKNGESTTYEETIVEGPKGISVKMYSKDKNGIEKISISGSGDKFVMRTMEGDKKDEKTLTRSELLEELKKNKKLKFAADFAKTQKGGAWLRRGSSKKSKKRSSTKRTKRSKKH